MALTALANGKGKLVLGGHEVLAGSPSASSSESESDNEDEITPEYLESLLEKARQNAASSSGTRTDKNDTQEDVITLNGSAKQ